VHDTYVDFAMCLPPSLSYVPYIAGDCAVPYRMMIVGQEVLLELLRQLLWIVQIAPRPFQYGVVAVIIYVIAVVNIFLLNI